MGDGTSSISNKRPETPSIPLEAQSKGLTPDEIQGQDLLVNMVGYPVLNNSYLPANPPPIEKATNENLSPAQEEAAGQEAQDLILQNVIDGVNPLQGTITIPTDPPLPPPAPNKPLPSNPLRPPQGKAPSPPQEPLAAQQPAAAQAAPASQSSQPAAAQPAAAPQQKTWALEKFVTYKKAKLVGGISLGVIQGVTFVGGGAALATLGGALSATGIGAVVGVPLILAGAVAAGAGAYGGGVQVYDSVLEHQGKPTYSSQQKPKTGAEGLSQKELNRRYENWQNQLKERTEASASPPPATATPNPTTSAQSTTSAQQSAPQPSAPPAAATSASAPVPQQAAPTSTPSPRKLEQPIIEELPDDDDEDIKLTKKKKENAEEAEEAQIQGANKQEAEQPSKTDSPQANVENKGAPITNEEDEDLGLAGLFSEEPKTAATEAPPPNTPQITDLPENEPTITFNSSKGPENLKALDQAIDNTIAEAEKDAKPAGNQAQQGPVIHPTDQRIM